MTLHFNVKGDARKAMVKAISEKTAVKAVYLGVPSCAYQIGDYTVGKNGELDFDDSLDVSESSDIINVCVEATGNTPAEWENNEPQDAPQDEETETVEVIKEGKQTADTGESVGCGCPVDTSCEARSTDRADRRDLTVKIPADKVNIENLTNLLDAKGWLIKKALRITDLPVETDEDTVVFPWFASLPDSDEIKAYTNLITALCKMSKEQKRINASKKDAENEKYAFRCFLLRLGFVGSEFKTDRKILLKNLTGSSAFKNGRKKEDAEDEISE